MATFRELVEAARAEITEVDVQAAAALVTAGATLLDVREPDEHDQGAVAGSIHIPRGQLESVIEAQVGDRSTPIVVMCAGGTRSAFAAKTLADMGYDQAVSLAGGFNAWKDAGRPWAKPQSLGADQRSRYHRHLLLPEVGQAGQLKLLQAKVCCLGAGGLGSPAALYLAAAGVGTIGMVDMDVVDESNLQRQILHTTGRVGQPKVESAATALAALNPGINIVTHNTRLGADNVIEIMSGYDLIIDGADNFGVRYLVNDASVKLGLPVVHGSIFRFEGQVSVFDPRRGPTYRDMVPKPPPPELAPNCAEAGVIGVLPGIIGSIQALEAIKLIVGIGDPLIGRLLAFDALELEFHEYKLGADPANPVTWANRDRIEIIENGDVGQVCAAG